MVPVDSIGQQGCSTGHGLLARSGLEGRSNQITNSIKLGAQVGLVEIPAGDTAKAREFWGGLFGWQFEAFEGSPTEYHTTRFSDTQGGAIMEADGDERGARVYFDVDDINAGAARAKELGGEAGGRALAIAMAIVSRELSQVGKATGQGHLGD